MLCKFPGQDWEGLGASPGSVNDLRCGCRLTYKNKGLLALFNGNIM